MRVPLKGYYKASVRVPLKGYYKGSIRVPLKGALRLFGPCLAQRAQYPLIKEESLRPRASLKGSLKGIFRGSIRGLRNSGLNYIGLHITM